MHFRNLDQETRRYMRGEVERDISEGALYISPRISSEGVRQYATLLLAAIDSGSSDTLTFELGAWMGGYELATRKGKTFTKKIPANAAQLLAEGEFNRYYARGLCLRARADGEEGVRVYRAKEVMTPRPESEEMVGNLLNVDQLLSDLRTHIGVDTVLGLPPGPNSGLSVELVR